MKFSEVSLFVVILLQLSVCFSAGQPNIQVDRSFTQELNNVAFNDTVIYVAENNKLHVLNSDDLSITETAETCVEGGCPNVNRILLVNRDTLITCGTGNSRQCEIRSVQDISTVRKSSGELVVSDDLSRSVIGKVIQEDKLLLLMTYGSGLAKKQPSGTHSYAYPAQITTIVDYAFKSPDLSYPTRVLLTLPTEEDVSSFLIIYKTIVESDRFVYMLTNQKNLVGESYKENVTKVISICKSDERFYTYADIVIQCIKGDKDYNLLQDATILDAGILTGMVAGDQLFVGTFTSAADPDNVSGDSAICVEKLSVLDQKILDAKTTNCKLPNENRYLSKPSACGAYNSSQESCQNSNFPIYKYVIGNTSHTMSPVYSLSADQGYITKVSGLVVPSTDTVVIQAGTSRGHLIQMNLMSFGDQLEVYEDTELHRASTVSAIYTKGSNSEEPFYVMTKTKLIKYPKSNCSTFMTCEETFAARNPYCGWCVYEDKSTTEDMCPQNGTNHWLSIVTACVSLAPVPEGQLADNSPGQVSLNVSQLPDMLPGDTFQCRFLKDGVNISQALAVDSDGIFNCSTPGVNEHIKMSLELWVTRAGGFSLRLAHTDFLFYKCDHYKNCGDCVLAEGATCSWCKLTAVCSTTCPVNATVTSGDACPQLVHNEPMYIHQGLSQEIQVQGKNLVSNATYTCELEQLNVSEPASLSSSTTITCSLNLAIGDNEKKVGYGLTVQYTVPGTDESIVLDDFFNTSVVVYNCSKMGEYCSHCHGLNLTRYNCEWCGDTCKYNDTDCTRIDTCPAPVITRISPSNGPNKGGIIVTITGSDLGLSIEDIQNVTLADMPCTNITAAEVSSGEDFAFQVPDKISCTAGKATAETAGLVKMVVKDQPSTESVKFTYRVPVIRSVSPSSGPKAGGTVVRFYGDHLGIGSRSVKMRFNKDTDFGDCLVLAALSQTGLTFFIKCTVPASPSSNVTSVQLQYSPSTEFYTYNISFGLVENPDIQKLSSQSTILGGGTKIEVEGRYLNNSHSCTVSVTYEGQPTQFNDVCSIQSSQRAIIKAPAAPQTLQDDLDYHLNETGRMKRDVTCPCISTSMRLQMDGVHKDFLITYYPNPIFDGFGSDILLFDSDSKQLVLHGSRLDLVAGKEDYQVTIGTEECSILELTNMTLTCVAPKDQPSPKPGHPHPGVYVTVGNVLYFIGYIEYKIEVEIYITILAVVGGTISALLVIGVVVGACMYKKQGRQKMLLQQKLEDTEMEIKRVAREEFLDMHTTMLTVNKNLVEKGFPYHTYPTYACNVMFAADQRLYDQVVLPPSETADQLTSKKKQGMEALEKLLLNKFFIVSLISTLEKQKKFFFREKANFSGNLCAILLGKMPFLQEIVQVLVENFVQEAVAKKHHKTLFRRCESITENILGNWLALTLYPHLKNYSGSPLYLLYMAMQKTMESGPIDIMTGDAKCTLSEEKLLKNWSSTDMGVTEVKFEAKTLSLKVVVDNGETMFDCKALDCDTITQVKAKCLNQIYVNYPASQLNIDPKELKLEWHAGHSGSLSLKDEDRTSNIEGDWLRLNTLAHYNVQDGSNMALIDPRCTDIQQQEDYVNLQQVTLETKIDSTDSSILIPSLAQNDQNSLPQRRWHLVKPSAENTERPERSAIEDLYLNRLFTTKQSMVQYMKSLFDIILDHTNCPPPIKFLYDLLDEVGEKHRVDADTVHAWKSHSYAVRVWGILIRQPCKLFDIHVPSYVEDSLDVIAQVFNESFSLTAQKFTKDSSAQKLIFHNEMNRVREQVKKFYAGVKFLDDQKEILTTYLTDLNRVQLQDNGFFNKTVFLYKLYQQIQPYLDEINDDLSMNKDCCKLGLSRKLEELVSMMEEET